MKRTPTVAALLVLALLVLGCPFSQAQAPIAPVVDTQPETPPGTQPAPLVAPLLVPPDSSDDEPKVDDLKPKPAIVVEIGGEVVTAEVVSVNVGQLVEVKPQGAADGVLVRWNFSSAIKYKTKRDLGHYLAFTFTPDDVGRVILLGAVWNGDPNGFAAGPMRWIVVSGHGPQPPPVVDPNVPPKPVVDPATVGPFRALIVTDTDGLGDLPRAQREAIQSAAVMNYLNAKCVKESDGVPSWRNWDDSFTDDQITDGDWLPIYRATLKKRTDAKPWVSIYRNGVEIHSAEYPASEDEALALFKRFGG